jgi:hypothetical protein
MRLSKSKQKRRPVISHLPAYRISLGVAAQKAVPSENEALALLSAHAVRSRCAIVSEAVERGESRYFRLVPGRLDETVRRVVDVTRRCYGDRVVPYHSRWRHFSIGATDRAALVAPGANLAERARARLDLVIVSVLLDAGAGPRWRYREVETGQVLSRSEGLAVASLRAMQSGLFSCDPVAPWRADAEALARVTFQDLSAAFQHASGNELVGLEGRVLLLRRLGQVCAASPILFGTPARPGGLYDYWSSRGEPLPADGILRTLLHALGPIWPGRISLAGIPLGDCGRHPAIPGDGIVPFHKLSQWLTYSLVEPLEAGGLRVVEIDRLTGLPEYRNGGLFLDCGVIVPRDPGLLHFPLDAMSEPVVEWRALTVRLLDRLASLVCQRLGKTADEFPLVRMLEGGSWAAGREIAFERRQDGSSPLAVVSDGTLF